MSPQSVSERNWDLELLILVVISLSVHLSLFLPFSTISGIWKTYFCYIFIKTCYLKFQMSKPLLEDVLEKRVFQYLRANSLKNTCEGTHFLVNFYSQLFFQDFDLRFIWLLLGTLNHHRNSYQRMGWTPKKKFLMNKNV